MHYVREHLGKIWTVVGVVAGLAITTSFTVLGYSSPDFDVARFCFEVSALVITIASIATFVSISWPFWMRVLVSGTIGAITLILLTEALRLVAHRANRPVDTISAATPEKPRSSLDAEPRSQHDASVPTNLKTTSQPKHAKSRDVLHPSVTDAPAPAVVDTTGVPAGNLKQRLLRTMEEMRFDLCRRGWDGRACAGFERRFVLGQMPPDNNDAAGQQWMQSLTGFFLWKYLDRIIALRAELAGLHLIDERIDWIIDKWSGVRSRTKEGLVEPNPIFRYVYPQEVEELLERLHGIASQLR